MQTETMPTAAYFELPLDHLVESPWNPRKHYDQAALEELAASIREKGVIEPIVVRPIVNKHLAETGRYEIVAGSRRFRASKLAERPLVPAIVRQLDDVAALELAVVENQQRDDIHPLDEAEGYAALMKAGKKAYTVNVVAAKVGKSLSYIYRRLKLLELDAPLKTALAEDRLSVAHAEALLRLPAKLRAEAAHPENGVVWRHNPLLDYSATWIPAREDLRPLNELERFIRDRSHFDPASEDTRHFQPALAEQLDDAIEQASEASEFVPEDREDREQEVSSVIELSDDPMARMRLKADKNQTIPLTPSKWREVKSEKDRCAFTQRGVITHGGPARVLNICIKRICPKHWPVAKKKPATRTSAGTTPAPAKTESTWERDDRLRKEREAAWAPIWPDVKTLILKHTAQAKLTYGLIRSVFDCGDEIGSWYLERVKKTYDLTLSERTIAQAIALIPFTGIDERKDLDWPAKVFGFNLKPIDKLVAAAKANAAKTATKLPVGKAAKKGKAK